MTPDYDIVVVGAGLAGACAAALLARHAGIEGPRVALLAAELPAAIVPGSPPQLRVVALSRASERVLRAAGAWQRLDQARLCAYERMLVWRRAGANADADADSGVLCFDAAEVGEPNLGHIGENTALLHACCDSFAAAGGTLISGRLAHAVIGPDAVRLQCGASAELSTRLLVGADGAQSPVREFAGLTVRRRDYRELAIVANVRTARPHRNTAWQRFLTTGPLAFLPLFDGSSSIVWSVDEAQAEVLRDCSPEQFNQRLAAALDGVLGATTLVSERLSFELRSVAADSYVAPRCALIGDAAHVIHPLAGQGANLGLLDAAALCEAVAEATLRREDPGALRVLRAYEQQRRTHNLLMDAAMSALHRAFGTDAGPAAGLLDRALGIVHRSGMLKRAFARHALGTAGELPRLARAGVDEAPAGAGVG